MARIRMRAVIFAAGMGRRLGAVGRRAPKVLLRFGGRSLLERHLTLLAEVGVAEVTVAVGFEAERVRGELARLQRGEGVHTVENPDYSDGSVTTLWCLREALLAGGEVLIMDGDVLYDRRLLQRLLASAHQNCFLLDRDVEPGEEPMKLAVRDGRPVDFRKTLERPHDYYGESVGFFRLNEIVAARLVEAAGHMIESGRRDEYFEEALREVLLTEPSGCFGFEDVTGLPWIEIDFPEDVSRAEREILPRLLSEDR
jgi:choline kinase